jgi:hypothetical protein
MRSNGGAKEGLDRWSSCSKACSTNVKNLLFLAAQNGGSSLGSGRGRRMGEE